MTRRLVTLVPAQVADLMHPCDVCQFWQGSADSLAGKEDWARQVLTEWGPFGLAVEVDDVLVAHILYAPARYLQTAALSPAGPVSDDAVLLAGLRVRPEVAGTGLGKLLVAKAAADLLQREVGALEAFSSQTPGLSGATGPACSVPARYLECLGFVTLRSRLGMSLHRLDLGSTVAWHRDLESLRQRLRALAKASAATAGWKKRPATARVAVRTAAGSDAARPDDVETVSGLAGRASPA
jgi:GNAT superfamily N-acetyltransferase